MYLYFDNKGILKEVVNDKALRQGSQDYNSIFIYWPNIETEVINSIWFRFVTQAKRYQQVQLTPLSLTDSMKIPYNPKRDLKFFEYGKDYKFYEIPTTFSYQGETKNVLSDFGTTSLSIYVTDANNERRALGKIVFNVEESTEGDGEIQDDEYITLAQWNYLLKILGTAADDEFVVYQFRGSVDTYSSLPSTDLEVGDTYNVLDTGKNYAWDGEEWDEVAGIISTAGFVTIGGTQTISGNKTFTGDDEFTQSLKVSQLNPGEFDLILDKTGGTFRPKTDSTTYKSDLGSEDYRWGDIWFTGKLKDGVKEFGLDDIPVNSELVHKTGAETITGTKTFNSQVYFTDNVEATSLTVQKSTDASLTLKQSSYTNNYARLHLYSGGNNEPGILGITFDDSTNPIEFWSDSGIVCSYLVPYNHYSEKLTLPNETGTLATQSYVQTQIALINYVDLTSNQSITGVKTFGNSNGYGQIKIGNPGDIVSITYNSDGGVIEIDKTVTIGQYGFWGGYARLGYLECGNSENGYQDLTCYVTALVPYTNASGSNGSDLGSQSYKWRDVYVGRNLTDGTNTVSVADIVSGLVSTSERNTWNAKYDKPVGGIPDSDIASASTWNAKQNALTFDDTPTLGSNNPVKSGGVYSFVLQNQNTLPLFKHTVVLTKNATDDPGVILLYKRKIIFFSTSSTPVTFSQSPVNIVGQVSQVFICIARNSDAGTEIEQTIGATFTTLSHSAGYNYLLKYLTYDNSDNLELNKIEYGSASGDTISDTVTTIN